MGVWKEGKGGERGEKTNRSEGRPGVRGGRGVRREIEDGRRQKEVTRLRKERQERKMIMEKLPKRESEHGVWEIAHELIGAKRDGGVCGLVDWGVVSR
jgi:hypothetical protein